MADQSELMKLIQEMLGSILRWNWKGAPDPLILTKQARLIKSTGAVNIHNLDAPGNTEKGFVAYFVYHVATWDVWKMCEELLTNAVSANVRANRKGSVRMEVLRSLDGSTRINVSDQGPGLRMFKDNPMVLIPNDFHVDFNKELLLSRQGIGVAAVQALVLSHGGSLEYQGPEGWYKNTASIWLPNNSLMPYDYSDRLKGRFASRLSSKNKAAELAVFFAWVFGWEIAVMVLPNIFPDINPVLSIFAGVWPPTLIVAFLTRPRKKALNGSRLALQNPVQREDPKSGDIGVRYTVTPLGGNRKTAELVAAAVKIENRFQDDLPKLSHIRFENEVFLTRRQVEESTSTMVSGKQFTLYFNANDVERAMNITLQENRQSGLQRTRETKKGARLANVTLPVQKGQELSDMKQALQIGLNLARDLRGGLAQGSTLIPILSAGTVSSPIWMITFDKGPVLHLEVTALSLPSFAGETVLSRRRVDISDTVTQGPRRTYAQPAIAKTAVFSSNPLFVIPALVSKNPVLDEFLYWKPGNINLWNNLRRNSALASTGPGQTFVEHLPLESLFTRDGDLRSADLSAVTFAVSEILRLAGGGEMLVDLYYEGELGAGARTRIASNLAQIQLASGQGRVRFGLTGVKNEGPLFGELQRSLESSLVVSGVSLGFDRNKPIHSVVDSETLKNPQGLQIFAVELPSAEQILSAAALFAAGTMQLKLHTLLQNKFQGYLEEFGTHQIVNGIYVVLAKPRALLPEMREWLTRTNSTLTSV